MKKKLLFAASIALAALTSADYQAQVSAYSFTQSPGAYGAANSGSMVGMILQDDDVTTVNLPFAFNFNGSSYSTINVCSNGYLSFNAISGTEYQAISDASTQEILAPFAQDLVMATIISGDFATGSNVISNVSSTSGISVGDSLIDLFFDFGGYSPTVTAVAGNNITVNLTAQNNSQASPIIFMNGYIRQSVSGVTPNRICEFEYRNMARYGGFDEVINFKVKLYETSNKIEYVYGPMTPNSDNFNSEVGLKGTLANDFNSRFVASGVSWSNSVPATNIADDCDFSDLNFPANGLTYAWSATVCATPTLSVPFPNPAVCSGAATTISVTGAPNYSWSTGATGPQISITPTTTTTYTVTGFDGACSSTLSITQSVTPYPNLQFTPANPTLCVGASASITASGATTYSWNHGPTTAQIIVSPATNTTYVVTGSTSGCSTSSVVNLAVTLCGTGIANQQNQAKALLLYPNPNTGSFMIATEEQDASRRVTIYNMLGATVHTQDAGSAESIEVNVSLPEGVYYVELSGTASKQVKQIVITK